MKKKILLFVWLALAIIGAGACLIVLILQKDWLLLPFAVALIAMAFPAGREIYKRITTDE